MRMLRKMPILMLLVAVLVVGKTGAKASGGVIVVRGNKMFNAKTGERFFIKGLTYEYAVSDDYYDKYSKATIAKNLAGLDFNTLRIYNINPDKSYDKFMGDMAARGVYVLVAASPDNSDYFGKYRYSTIRKDVGPGTIALVKGVKTIKETETCYPALLLEYGKKVARTFAKYDNTLGIVVANEIMQKDLTAAACLKQYVADIKTWMRGNCETMRVLPLAYAAADSAYAVHGASVIPVDYHVIKMQGLLCGDTMKDGMMTRSIDIYLINEYRWCADASYAGTYGQFLQMAQGVPIVMGFGEFGCHQPKSVPREWPMVPYLFQQPTKTSGFTSVFSGGLAYSYGEANLNPDSTFPMFTGGSHDPLKEPSSTPTEDYTYLKAQYSKYVPFVEKAEWTSSSKCSWVPTLAEKITATNKFATASGWLIQDCTSDVLKLSKNDTWTTLTREGMICDNEGGVCSVSVSSAIGTTQQDLCGACKVESGGALCTSGNECGPHGQCVAADGKMTCKCVGCYSGDTCMTKTSACFKLTSNASAPKYIFAGVGAFIATMLAIFVGLAVVAKKKKNAMDSFGDQLKVRGPQGTPASLQAGAST